MIRPVILSGGGGTRLWPLSRSGNPKQFQRIVGEQSLLQATAQRCVGAGFGAPLISTGAAQRDSVIDQLQAIGVTPVAILLEPAARNTAPAIAAAAHWALARGEDDPSLVMPSDHSIPGCSSVPSGGGGCASRGARGQPADVRHPPDAGTYRLRLHSRRRAGERRGAQGRTICRETGRGARGGLRRRRQLFLEQRDIPVPSERIF